MQTSTVMYTQLQPWSSVNVSPCMEKISGIPAPVRVGEHYKTPRPHPWRPTLGYETVELSPLHSQPITNNHVDPCYTPQGMTTKPLRFPNLVTGFDRNPSHAARAALYTRYTPCDWSQNQIRLGNEVNANHLHSDELRDSAVRIMREADEKVRVGQDDAGRKLGERITDINFWEGELGMELERIIIENGKMQECKRSLQKAIQDLEAPIHIAQECLYHRETRQGNELVHDEPEQALLREIEHLRNCLKKLEQFVKESVNQLTRGRAAQHDLELDISNKNTALGIDTMCKQLNNFSNGLQYYGGIEKYVNCTTDAESWAQASHDTVKRSQKCRETSQRLQSEIDSTINTVAQKIWEAWSCTNNALSRRITETLLAKQKIQCHLHNIQKDIFGIEKNLELIKKGISDKSAALKVAHTRLEARSHRPESELCCDYAHQRIVQEAETIKALIDVLHSKLQECEAQHQQLLRTRANLETDLKSKADAVFIDREKCMGMRRSYPIVKTVKY
ncbi:tektin-3 [Fopius arisanus]|uniref:Tektin n=1 Tax=Fopius arisanus TaxID=64838 RepID=A0A9R1SWN8_9HYME|nr:PREDICTED: tektin-3-like [Fopius arisanus]